MEKSKLLHKNVFENEFVKQENFKLSKINETFHIENILSSNGYIIDISFAFPVKGNLEVIKRLEEDGWEKEKRYRKHEEFMDYSNHASTKYVGFVMYQQMRKPGNGVKPL